MPDEQPYDLTVVNEAPYDLVVEDGAYTLTLSGLGAQGIPGPAIATELEVTVRNQSGAPMTKGTIVYLSGSTGQRPLITKAQANNDANSAQTIGFLKDTINNNADGVVIVSGLLENINTQGLGDGTQLYLSPTTAGTWTTTKPSAPNHLVYVGIVVKAHITQGVIYVSVQNGYELNELHDVAISSPATGQFLKRNAGNTLWVNSSIVSADVTDATDANTPSTIVKRNPAGGFSAGAVEAGGLTVGSHQVSGFGLSKGNRSLNFPNTSAATPQTILIPESGGTLALTNDPRFTDARTPLAHTHFSADITDASPSNGAYTIVKRDGDGSAAFGAVTADYLVGSTEVLAGGYSNGMGLYSDGIRFYANDVQSLLQTAAINSTGRTYTLPDTSGTVILDTTLGAGVNGLTTITGAKSFSGQVQLTGQAATDANSAMTRGLVGVEPVFNSGFIRQITGYFGASASGSSSFAAAEINGFSLNSGVTLGCFAKISVTRYILGEPNFGGAFVNRTVPIFVSLLGIMEVPTSETRSRIRIIVGDTGSSPTFADQSPSSGTVFGAEIFFSSANNRLEVMPFACESGIVTYGTPVAFGNTSGFLSHLILSWNGAGTIRLFGSSFTNSGPARPTLISSQAGVATSGTWTDRQITVQAITNSGSVTAVSRSTVRAVCCHVGVGVTL